MPPRWPALVVRSLARSEEPSLLIIGGKHQRPRSTGTSSGTSDKRPLPLDYPGLDLVKRVFPSEKLRLATDKGCIPSGKQPLIQGNRRLGMGNRRLPIFKSLFPVSKAFIRGDSWRERATYPLDDEILSTLLRIWVRNR